MSDPLAELRARLHWIAVAEAGDDEDDVDSGSLSEDEERARSDWPR